MTNIQLNLPESDVRLILRVLSRQPFGVVADCFIRVNTQMQVQLAPPEPPKVMK